MSHAKIKNQLLEALKAHNCLWSYDTSNLQDMPDDMLIEKTLVYLDLPEIDQLIALYGKNHVKRVFREQLVP